MYNAGHDRKLFHITNVCGISKCVFHKMLVSYLDCNFLVYSFILSQQGDLFPLPECVNIFKSSRFFIEVDII